ncbi:glycosyltransferase family 2 protein [Ferruginibacter sp. HRS2-29]|uniref:glycosyltransferase family 2 protein n=1 Tax=Ferruginibacter sp. HRS2-29 TaxID=2487334 RepID=UPI0020CE9A0E|nr:glycosyltransferase family 2 protein [Ferruginibacter sp. HRS2-29]MCP9749914.1 glycosyltransferase family 2 protein [Ferruginibacter sp. HRS2-29]
MTQPLISIIITSYNRAHYIEQAIQSALAQDYPRLEIVISDNHSTDNTREVLQKYLPDPRIKYFVNEVNIGMIPNFKLATEDRATGKYVSYISSDDYLCCPSFISKAVELINKYPDVVLVAAKNATLFNDSGIIEEDDSGHVFQKEFMPGMELFEKFPEWLLPGWGAVLMDRRQLIEADIFGSKAQSLDYEANLKLILNGNAAFINQPSYIFRKHDSNASGFMTYEAHVNNLEFIENTCRYARELNKVKDLEKWRKRIYSEYLNRNSTVLLKSREEFGQLLQYVRKEKKLHFTLFNAPKLTLNSFVYRNYKLLFPALKWVFPKKYEAIKKLAG